MTCFYNPCCFRKLLTPTRLVVRPCFVLVGHILTHTHTQTTQKCESKATRGTAHLCRMPSIYAHAMARKKRPSKCSSTLQALRGDILLYPLSGSTTGTPGLSDLNSAIVNGYSGRSSQSLHSQLPRALNPKLPLGRRRSSGSFTMKGFDHEGVSQADLRKVIWLPCLDNWGS